MSIERARPTGIAFGVTLVSAVTAITAATAAEPQTPWPGPARGPMAAQHAERNASCEGCHTAISEEWRASMHRAAFADPTFQRALAREPLPFCRGCHAPETDPSRQPSALAANIGVACVTCHVPAEGILATDARDGSPGPHPVLRDSRFATQAACARCHEFPFPDSPPGGRRAWMQSTVTEHARSPYASISCASCHMPSVGQGANRHRSHAFASTRSPAALARALEVRAMRAGNGVRFELTPKGVGHAFPTGDLFRRLALVVEAVDEKGIVRAQSVDYLGRRFDVVRQAGGAYGTACIEDDRLIGATTRSLPLPSAPSGTTLRWRVIYQRVEHPNSPDENTAISAEDIELARGALARS